MGKYEIDVEDLNELEDRYGVTIKGRQPRKRTPKTVSYTHLTLPTSDLV